MITHFAVVRRHHGSVGELSPGQRLQCCCRGFHRVELDKDLADAGRLSASAGWAWHLEIDNLAVLGAFFADVVADF